ncbi:glyoxalase superfamily protein [Oceanibacterium hippocampi]|uniref:Glyoxalase-related protein domain-containing protein n=1 Tax=Oceanibacterium hippocampi TaxID=745714 RepID=A0A1Y5U1J0_9PROT|nr:glyoxalase superfamily protein [Oceanibacterium hippocampi]SLN76797.1 hypothetical protein OCH7691_04191 [Oceanibacterium hippocampi]
MNGSTNLPSLEDLKDQARRLRAELARSGQDISHGRALELIASQHGFRDWNTLHARVGNGPPVCPVKPGDRVAGQYLGQDFKGEVVGVQILAGASRYRIAVHFDEPVDVVTFESFSNFRRRVSCTIDETGRTQERTSNGKPHMVLKL